jgi:DNA-binding beta-propeller fold protein YncE
MYTRTQFQFVTKRAVLCVMWLGVALFCAWGFTSQAAASQVEGLLTPQSFLADPSGEFYFISNINGEADAKDNNGFITRLDKDGKITDLHFIQGGQNGTTLHAPKGMAIIDRLLYVVDVDTLRGFDKETGRAAVTVSLQEHLAHNPKQPIALIDVAYDGNGTLYLSDTEADTIYRVEIARQHAVSIVTKNSVLSGPAGIAWNAKTGKLVAVSWNKGKIFEITPNGTVSELVSNSFFSSRFHNLSGVDFDEWGSMYVSDFSAGKVWRIRPDMKFEVIAEYLSTPADIGIDRKGHLILVPYYYGNAAEMNGLERPSTGGGTKKRSLADYGFDGMKKGPGQ